MGPEVRAATDGDEEVALLDAPRIDLDSGDLVGPARRDELPRGEPGDLRQL